MVEMAEEERLVAWFMSCIFMTDPYTYNYIISRHHFGLEPLDVLRLDGSHLLVRRWCRNCHVWLLFQCFICGKALENFS